jgi:hypothetical protein
MSDDDCDRSADDNAIRAAFCSNANCCCCFADDGMDAIVST